MLQDSKYVVFKAIPLDPQGCELLTKKLRNFNKI